MKWITEWVPADQANDRLTELANTNWFVSQIHPIPARSLPPQEPDADAPNDRVFIAACQREPKAKKKGKA